MHIKPHIHLLCSYLTYRKEPMTSVDEPIDLVRLSLSEVIYVKCKNGRFAYFCFCLSFYLFHAMPWFLSHVLLIVFSHFCRELRGKLHAFDQHLNVILSDVTETITTFEEDEENEGEEVCFSFSFFVKRFSYFIFYR